MAHVFSSSLAVNGNRVCDASSSRLPFLTHIYPPCTLTFVVAVSRSERAVQHLSVEGGTYLSITIVSVSLKNTPPFLDGKVVKQ